jgi:hypothetical protein
VKPRLHTHKEYGMRLHHLLHTSHTMDSLDSPIKWRCPLRVLCLVRRPVTALDCVLLKDINLALTPRHGPRINSRACLWVLPIPYHHSQCWLTNQRLIIRHISCLETPKDGSGPTNLRAEPPLASTSAISLPLTPACVYPIQPHSMLGGDKCNTFRKQTAAFFVGNLICFEYFWWWKKFL